MSNIDDEVFSIYFTDLTPEAQKRFIEAFGDNGNYDVWPLADIPITK